MIICNRNSFSNIFFSFILILLFSSNTLKAQNNNTYSASTINLEQLLSTLQKDQKATEIWWNSWLGLYATGTIIQSGIALKTDNKILKQDMYLGAATTLLGTASQVLTPMIHIDKSFFENTQNLSPQERLDKMNEAYALLEQSSAFASSGRSWKMHALTSVVNLGGGLITWLAFDRTLKDGLINFAINTVVTEAQIWTQPIIAKKALNNYADYFIRGEFIPNNKPQAFFSANATASGFQFKVVF